MLRRGFCSGLWFLLAFSVLCTPRLAGTTKRQSAFAANPVPTVCVATHFSTLSSRQERPGSSWFPVHLPGRRRSTGTNNVNIEYRVDGQGHVHSLDPEFNIYYVNASLFLVLDKPSRAIYLVHNQRVSTLVLDTHKEGSLHPEFRNPQNVSDLEDVIFANRIRHFHGPRRRSLLPQLEQMEYANANTYYCDVAMYYTSMFSSVFSSTEAMNEFLHATLSSISDLIQLEIGNYGFAQAGKPAPLSIPSNNQLAPQTKLQTALYDFRTRLAAPEGVCVNMLYDGPRYSGFAGISYVFGACSVDGTNTALVATVDPHLILVATAHELGHTFGAQHVASNTIMNAYIDGVAFTFSSQTQAQLLEFAEDNYQECFVHGNSSHLIHSVGIHFPGGSLSMLITSFVFDMWLLAFAPMLYFPI